MALDEVASVLDLRGCYSINTGCQNAAVWTRLATAETDILVSYSQMLSIATRKDDVDMHAVNHLPLSETKQASSLYFDAFCGRY